MGVRPKSKAIQSIQRALGATDIFTQAAVLSLYDPDRAQTVTYRGEVRGWGDFLSARCKSALGSQKAKQGAGPPVPDRDRSRRRRSPS